MTTVTLSVALLLSVLLGQSTFDREAYAIYQAKLAAMTATQTPSPAGSATVVGVTGGTAAATGACILVTGSGNSATTADCTACHVEYQSQHSHPVDVAQDATRSRALRPASEVVKRGVFLADGKVTCLSCHDGNSTWKYKLALPPDSQARPRVKPREQATYATGLVVRTAAASSMPAGSDVSPTPLCKACHGFD